jgi:hypothetical protein
VVKALGEIGLLLNFYDRKFIEMLRIKFAQHELIIRVERQQMPRKNQPENAETRQHKHRRLKFPPNLVSLACPGIDGVIENHECSDRTENADRLNQPNPNISAVAE